jgi:hypothetical protein
MHLTAPAAGEVIVPLSFALFANVVRDEATIVWLQENAGRLSLVVAGCMFIAIVSCLIWPAESKRVTLARILASGVIGFLLTMLSVSVGEVGGGVTATAIIVAVGGFAGWFIFLTGIEVAREAKESGSMKGALGNAISKVANQIFKPGNEPPSNPPDSTKI